MILCEGLEPQHKPDAGTETDGEQQGMLAMDDIGENFYRDHREDNTRSQVLEVTPSFGAQRFEGRDQGAK